MNASSDPARDLQVENLESRILYSAAPVDLPPDAQAPGEIESVDVAHTTVVSAKPSPSTPVASHESSDGHPWDQPFSFGNDEKAEAADNSDARSYVMGTAPADVTQSLWSEGPASIRTHAGSGELQTWIGSPEAETAVLPLSDAEPIEVELGLGEDFALALIADFLEPVV